MQDQHTNISTNPADPLQSTERIELDTLRNEGTEDPQPAVRHTNESPDVSPSPMIIHSQGSASLPSNVSIVAPTASISQPRTPSTDSRAGPGIGGDQADWVTVASDENPVPADFLVPSINEPFLQQFETRNRELENEQGASRNRDFEETERPPPFATYGTYVRSLLETFPDLRDVYMNYRMPHLDVSIVDIGVNGVCTVQDFKAFSPTFSVQHDPVYNQFRQAAKQFISEEVDMRLVLVQDISNLTIELLGSAFDLDPEFFAEHLRLSDHRRVGSDRFEARVVPRELIYDVYEFENMENPTENLAFINPFRHEISSTKIYDASRWAQHSMLKSYRSV